MARRRTRRHQTMRGAGAVRVMSDPPAQNLAEAGPEIEDGVPAEEQNQHDEDDDARHGRGERIVEHIERRGDGVAHEMVAGAAEYDRHGAVAESADEAEDEGGEDAGQ